jgi:dihydrofolate reductase
VRRIRYSVAMSLDGYIAGPNGEADWIVMDPEIDFAAMMSEFDTILLGRKTYEATKSYGGGSMPGVKSFVVSSTLRQEDCPGVDLINKDLKASVAKLKNAPGKDIWLFGGGELFRSLLDLGLVDSVEVAVVPVLLGEGIPLAPPSSKRAKLRLVKTKTYKQSGIVALEYAVER